MRLSYNEWRHQKARAHEPDRQRHEWGTEGQRNFADREVKSRDQHRKYRQKQHTRFAHAMNSLSLIKCILSLFRPSYHVK